jgi:uncharacterized membrane protein YuzA (DUF378 family)
MKAVHMVASVLAWVGALNWGLVGLGQLFNAEAEWNLVTWVIGSWSPVTASVVYVLVGVSAVYLALTHKSSCKDCQVAPVQPTM